MQQMIAQLKRVEELTNFSWQELMAMNDTERGRIDREAGILHKAIALQILYIKQLNANIRQRIDALCGARGALAGIQAECDAMQIPFTTFVLYSAGQITVAPDQEKKCQVAGMRGVHLQARLIRAALEQLLQQ